MNPNLTRQRFRDDHQDLPPSQVVALTGSHRRVAWPALCPACGAAASTHIHVAKVFGRRSQYGNQSYYRFIVRMPIPFCRSCADRHQQLVSRVPSVIGSFLRTPAVLSLVGAVAVATILSMIFLQAGAGVSPGARLYAFGGIVLLVGLGIVLTAREAGFSACPADGITSACDFSDNVGLSVRPPPFLCDPQPRVRRRVHQSEPAAPVDGRDPEARCLDLGNRVRGADRRGADRVARPRLTSSRDDRSRCCVTPNDRGRGTLARATARRHFGQLLPPSSSCPVTQPRLGRCVIGNPRCHRRSMRSRHRSAQPRTFARPACILRPTGTHGRHQPVSLRDSRHARRRRNGIVYKATGHTTQSPGGDQDPEERDGG